MDELTAQQLAELRADLQQLDSDLLELLENTEQSAQPVDLDNPIGRLTRVDAMHQQGILKANRTVAQNRRQQVARAMVRLEEELYGCCEMCGEYIAYARLKAYPETPNCLSCQSELESRLS